MLACYLTWHLRRAWAPLTFTDQDPPAPANPIAPARRKPRGVPSAPAGRHVAVGRNVEHESVLGWLPWG